MEAPHQTNGSGDISSRLKDARDRLKLLRAEQRLRQTEMQLRLMEHGEIELQEAWGYPGYTSNQWGGFVDATDAVRDPDLWDLPTGSILPGRRDMFAHSQPGILWPIIRTEMDFDSLRAAARVLSDVNDMAKGILLSLRNFTIKKGFKYQVLPKSKLGPDDGKLAEVLAPLIQKCDDDFCELNDRASREKENCNRRIRDGEIFERVFCTDRRRGTTVTRYVEPEQVRRPMGSPREWSWGIHTDKDDIETIISYAVEYAGNTEDWEDVPAAEIFHSKANVDRTIKRGISDFYCTQDGLEGVRKLRRALRVGAAMQASIPWVEQFDSARQAAVAAGVQSAIDALQPAVTDAITGKALNFQRWMPGTVLKIGKGREYIKGPLADSAGNNVHISIGQYDARCIGVRWAMPEYMITGDASNNNFASILVAGSPFVNAVEGEQDEHVKHNLAIHWTAIKNAADARQFIVNGRVIDFATIKRVIDLHCTPPQVAIANKLEEANVDEKDMNAGVLSKQTRREKLGLDNDKEAANIKADPIAKPAGEPGQGGLNSALAALLGNDPRDQRRPDRPQESIFPSKRREVTDANGAEHGADGKFGHGSGGGSGGNDNKGNLAGAESGLNDKIHEKLAGEIEALEKTPEGRRTLAKGAEVAAKIKTTLKAGVEAALKAADEGSNGGVSLIAGGHAAAGAAQLFSSVFHCVHQEVFEYALADHLMPGAAMIAKAAGHVAAHADTALMKAIAWSWRKVSGKESRRDMLEARQQLTDADNALLDGLARAAALAVRELLKEAGVENPEVDEKAARTKIAELLGVK